MSQLQEEVQQGEAARADMDQSLRAQLAESAARLSRQQAEAEVSLLLSEIVSRVERSQDVAVAHQQQSQQVQRMKDEVQRITEIHEFQQIEDQADRDAREEEVREARAHGYV